jgi:hypothetical protein
LAPCHPAQYVIVVMSCSVIRSTYICRCITLNYSERRLRRSFHSCRFNSHTECVVCPSIFLRLTLFSTDGFAGECCTTRESSPSPIDSTRSVGSPRAFPHSQTRPSVLGHDFVPVVSSLAGASGRIWLEYWLHSILGLRSTVLQREYTHQGSYRACFKNIYLAKWTRANGESVADT